MKYPASSYVEERDEGLYVAGSRVSLDSVVIRFQRGAEPEKIVSSFPTLSIDQVRGGIAYYLENQDLVCRYLDEGDRLSNSIPRVSETNPELYARLMAVRDRLKKQPA